MPIHRSFRQLALVAFAALAVALPAAAQTTLRVVMHSDLKIVDPIWTTAYITRNHGYMIYDTLFATGREAARSSRRWSTSTTCRPTSSPGPSRCATASLWHDGTPVTAEDCVASIKRWGAKDAIGQKLLSFVEGHARRRRQDLPHHAQGADRPRADGARQAVVERAVHDAEARRRDRSQHADLRLHGLRPVRLQEGRVEARRQDGLRQVRQVQAARRARVGPRRRQGRQGRPRRVARASPTSRRPSTRCSPARSTSSRRRRTTCCRSCARTRTSSSSTGTRWATSTRSASTRLHKPFDNAKVRQARVLRASTRRTS